MNTSDTEAGTHSVAILAGGRSTRMGFDKAQARFGSSTLLERIVGVAAATRPRAIYVCGGPPGSTSDLDVEHLVDPEPNEGPLVGLLAAIDADPPGDRLACVAVDLPLLAAETILEVLSALGTADVVVPTTGGRRQWHLGVWHVDRCRAPLREAYESGARSFALATESLDVAEIEVCRPIELIDVDTRHELLDSGGRPPTHRGLS